MDGAHLAGVWTDADDWTEADIPRRQWVAPGYLLRGAVTLVAGPPSTMKSSLMLGWACAAALGRDYGHFKPSRPVRAVVYNVEDDQQEQRRRLSAALRQFGASPCDIRHRIIRAGPTGIGTLLTRDDAGMVMPTLALCQLKELLSDKEQEPPGLIVVDPLAELHNAEENDNTALRAIVAEFRKLAIEHNVAVVMAHHTRKGGNASPGDPDIARGASAIIGAVRVAVTLTGMSEQDAAGFGLPTDAKARSAYIRLDDAKSNYAAFRDAAWFEKVGYELDNGEYVPAAVPWTPPAAKAPSLEDLIALSLAIEAGCPTGEPWSPRLAANEPRSIKPLLEGRGFAGDIVQKTVIAKLVSDFGVQTVRFKSSSRNVVNGMRLGEKPAAEWIE